MAGANTGAVRTEVIIIGGGPAGLSGALVLGRCGRRVVLIDEGKGRNRTAQSVHGYLTRDGIAPAELRRIGSAEARRYGVRLLRVKAVDARRPARGGFVVTLSDGRSMASRALLLATGIRDIVPEIPGLGPLYGTSVHHCPYCDAHRYRGEAVAALGAPKAAIGLAQSLLTWTNRVFAVTNGARLLSSLRRKAQSQGIGLCEEPILRLEGRRGQLRGLRLEDGSLIECRGLFFNTGQYQRSDLPRRLGCRFREDGGVLTDERQATGVPGLFLAGDADKDVQFSIVAAAEGAVAGVAINRMLQREEARRREGK